MARTLEERWERWNDEVASGSARLQHTEPGDTRAGDTHATPTVPTILEGRYRLEAEIGRGGMGVVWRGTQLALDRAVAVKLLAPGMATDDAVARFRREALTASRLAHPGIVGVLDAGVSDGVPYLVMELVDGVSLDQRVATRGRLALGEALHIARQITEALRAAHQAGIIHRDVKPANVMLATDGRARLVDFGLASLVRDQDTRLTRAGIVVGTPDYLAPELARGAPADPRADLYALGATLYEMITGQPPFERGEPLATLLAHLHEEPAPASSRAPGVPAEVDALLHDLLAKRPDDRPAGADAVLARLVALAPEPAPGADSQATVIAIARRSEETGALVLPPGMDSARAPSGELLLIVARSEDALATLGHLGHVAAGVHRGPLDRVGTIALGEGVRGAIRLARLASDGQSMISSDVHDDVGLGWIARLRGAGRRISTARGASDVFVLGEGEPAVRVPSHPVAEGRAFRCVCGSAGLVAPPLSDAPTVLVRCSACSGLCELVPGGEPAELATLEAPLASQGLALPEHDAASESAGIIDALAGDAGFDF